MHRFVRCATGRVSIPVTQCRFVIDQVWCVGDPHSQSLTDSLLLLDFPQVANDIQAIHKNCYLKVKRESGPATMPVEAVRGGSRVATTVAVHAHKTGMTMFVPVIVDTGAPRALYLSQQTWKLLGVDAKPRDDNTREVFTSSVGIGKWMGDALLSEEHGASDAHLKGANVLGMGLLGHNEVAISFTKLLADATHVQPTPPSDTWVTNGNVSFRVSPKYPDVAALKQAIKPDALPLEAAQIIIKDPSTGKAMGDEDALRAGVKYVFELPPAK